jgi:hypothetical protein
MLTDDQLGDRLRTRLAGEVAHIHSSPGTLPAVHRRRARRAAAGRIAVAVPALAVAVATGVVATGAGVRHTPAAVTSTGTRTGRPPLRDAAYVAAHARAALARLSDYVLRSQMTPTPGYRDLDQVDMKTGRARFDTYGTDGPLNSIGMSGSAGTNPTVLVVDYPHRAWWTYRMTPPPNLPNSARQLRIAPLQDPAEIADAIANGTAQVLGEQLVNDHQTLHLLVTVARAQLRITMDLWVDTQTYLPYRVTSTKAGRTSTSDFEWLPRTAANLAALNLVPPAGFTHRSTPIDPGAGGTGRG